GIEYDLSAIQTEGACAFREMTVVTDVDADARKRGVKTRVTEIAGAEVKLLPEAGIHVWNVVLAILAEIFSVGVDHGGGVVIDAGQLFFVDRHDDDHAVLFRDFLHQPYGWTVGNTLDCFIPARLLFRTKIRSREDLLHAENLHALLRGVFDVVQMFLDVQPLDFLDRQVGRGGVGTLY